MLGMLAKAWGGSLRFVFLKEVGNKLLAESKVGELVSGLRRKNKVGNA